MATTVADNGVFVCGSPYSESGMVAWALAQHPKFAAGPESRFLFKIFGRSGGLSVPFLYGVYQECQADGGWLAKQHVTYPELLRSLGSGVGTLFASRSEGRRWVENSPENALFIDELLLMFPAASVIGIRESPETALLAGLGGSWVDADEREVADVLGTWRHYYERLEEASSQNPARVFLIEQDELFDDPSVAFGACFSFLKEATFPAAATFFESAKLRVASNVNEARHELQALRMHRGAKRLIQRVGRGTVA